MTSRSQKTGTTGKIVLARGTAALVTATYTVPPTNENELLGMVLQLAKIFRYRSAHFRPALTTKGWRTPVSGDGEGFPDLVLVRPPRVIFAELKSDIGRMKPAQTEWHDDLTACAETGTVESYVWRPKDIDHIIQVMK